MADNGDKLIDNLLPDWETDHGGVDFGDIVVLIFDLVLLVYTGWRSWDFLTGTVPDGWGIMALIGLWGLDIGAVGWSLVWIFGSSTKYQDWVSMAFWIVDILGVVLTSLVDSLSYGDPNAALTKAMTPVAMVLIPLVVLGNVIAGFIYHFTSPATRARRARRKIEEEARRNMEKLEKEKLKNRYWKSIWRSGSGCWNNRRKWRN